jgi:hypothetical protein
MNRDYVLYHLREAAEELTRTIAEIENKADYDDVEFEAAMQHLYHHVNTAWNAREASEETARECSEKDFHAWRQFPTGFFLG